MGCGDKAMAGLCSTPIGDNARGTCSATEPWCIDPASSASVLNAYWRQCEGDL